MAQLRTKTAISYDPVNPLKTAKIIVEMVEWSERKEVGYSCSVNYIAEFATETQSVLKSRQIGISEDKFNSLYLAVDSSIPSSLTPYQKRELRKKLALLVYVTNDFIDEAGTKLIYNTIPSDWEIID